MKIDKHPYIGLQISKQFQKDVIKLKDECVRVLTDGMYKELKERYGEVRTLDYITSLYSIYSQFACILLKNIDESLKKVLSENEK